MNAAAGNRSPSPRWPFWRWKRYWQIRVGLFVVNAIRPGVADPPVPGTEETMPFPLEFSDKAVELMPPTSSRPRSRSGATG